MAYIRLHSFGAYAYAICSVRFLDNFSAGTSEFQSRNPFLTFILLSPGTRGATSAEYFLKAGYAVVFMHRQFSLQPFSRHYSHSTHPFLDFLEFDSGSTDSEISVTPAERAQLRQVLADYKGVQRSGSLLTLTFVTVNDYLWLLRAVSKEFAVLGRRSLFYLAAAVSDFFLPRQKMVRAESEVGVCPRW